MTGQSDQGELSAYKRLIARWDVWSKQTNFPNEKGRFGYFTKKEPLTQSTVFSTNNISSQYSNVYIVRIEFPLCIGKYAPGSQGFCDICLFQGPCTTETEGKL